MLQLMCVLVNVVAGLLNAVLFLLYHGDTWNAVFACISIGVAAFIAGMPRWPRW